MIASPESSSASHRYLPRRATSRICGRSACDEVGVAGQVPADGTRVGTSTVAIVRPATHLARPSRTVSTSGSSGMGSPVTFR